jgi:hypothetical protein
MPQWLVSSLSEVRKPNRAGVPVSGRRRRHESPILRGERDISRKAIARGMSDCLRCPVCLRALFLSVLHARPRVQRASGIPCSLILRDNESQTSGASCRGKADVYPVFETNGFFAAGKPGTSAGKVRSFNKHAVIPGMNAIAFTREVLASSASLEGCNRSASDHTSAVARATAPQRVRIFWLLKEAV